MERCTTTECKGVPHCRHENVFAAFEGKLCLFGGRRIQAVDIYDPDTNEWTSASAPPMEIHHFQPVIFGNQIWLVGTMTGEFPRGTPLDRVLIYTPDTDEWSFGPEIPAPRRRGAAGCVAQRWLEVSLTGIIQVRKAGSIA